MGMLFIGCRLWDVGWRKSFSYIPQPTTSYDSIGIMKTFLIALILLGCALLAPAQNRDGGKSLEGFDEYMAKVLKDWNGPGIAVGIVAGDKLVFAKGYGYRDYEKKLPFTPGTVCPIASNTKLFTAVAAGEVVGIRDTARGQPQRGAVSPTSPLQ